MTILKGQRGLIPYFTGESSTFTLTSSYTTFAEVPGTARNLVFEIYLKPSTGTLPADVRLVQAIPRLSAVTSDLNFSLQSTVYTQNTSSFTFSTGKGAYAFALQARQSTNSTSAGTIQAKWIGIS